MDCNETAGLSRELNQCLAVAKEEKAPAPAQCRGGQRGAVPGDPSGPPALHRGPAVSAEIQLVLERRG